MSFFSRLFGTKGESGKHGGDLRQRLERMEAEAAHAAPAFVGTTFNRAGDVALRGGDAELAVSYYGRAVDAFLDDGQREAARGVANKIIRVRPKAVRTLCTLTWLDLASRHTATALLHLRDYVAAAKESGASGLAADQIFSMARIVKDVEFLGAVADALDALDFASRASQVREWAKAGGSPDSVGDAEALQAACLAAATRSNEPLKPDARKSESKEGSRP